MTKHTEMINELLDAAQERVNNRYERWQEYPHNLELLAQVIDAMRAVDTIVEYRG